MLDTEASENLASPPEMEDIILSIWSFKTIIFGICFIAALISIAIAVYSPNVYQSNALLVPTETLQGSSKDMTSSLGGLASLAGIGGLNDKGFKAKVAQAKLMTKSFLYEFIEKHHLLDKLIAVEGWDKKSNNLVYNEDVYNIKNKEFLLPKSTNLKWLAYKKLINNLSVEEDDELLVLSYEHYSPYVAQYIVTNLVHDINQLMQNYDVEQADESIKYLNEKLTQTNVADMKTVFYNLIEEQTKNKMLTEIKKEYIFTTIDPALVPEEKSGPKRVFIVIVSVFLAAILGCFIALIRFYRSR